MRLSWRIYTTATTNRSKYFEWIKMQSCIVVLRDLRSETIDVMWLGWVLPLPWWGAKLFGFEGTGRTTTCVCAPFRYWTCLEPYVRSGVHPNVTFCLERMQFFWKRAGLDRNEGLSTTHSIRSGVEVVQLTQEEESGDDNTLPDWYRCDEYEALVGILKYSLVCYSLISSHAVTATSTSLRVSLRTGLIVCLQQTLAIDCPVNWNGLIEKLNTWCVYLSGSLLFGEKRQLGERNSYRNVHALGAPKKSTS